MQRDPMDSNFRPKRPEIRDDDPAVLADYLHASSAHHKRLTGDEIKALRSTATKSNKFVLWQILAGSIGGLFSGLQGLFTPAQKKHQATCVTGHLPPKTWGHGMPKCIDCGAEIRGPEDLRGYSRGS